jgi:eukaryotic-like serine/threonine-protein kinase
MKTRHLTLITLFVLIGMVFSACSGSISATSWPGVAVDQNNVYLSFATGVFAVRLADGQMVWRYPAEADTKLQFYASPALIDGQVIVGDYKKSLYNLDAAGGTETWINTNAAGRWVSSVLVVDDTILAPNVDHWLYALSRDNSLLWKFETQQPLWAAPASDGQFVYLPSMDHFLYALDIRNGNEKWKVDLGGAAVYSPALDEGGTLYVGTLGREMVAVRAADGSILWRFTTEKEVWGTPVLHEGILYFGDLSGKIYALNAADGTQAWQMDAGGAVTGGAALLADGLVFSTENGSVLLVGFDGTKKWTQTITGKLYGTPVVSNDLIVVGVTGGEDVLVVLTVEGTIKWTFKIPK